MLIPSALSFLAQHQSKLPVNGKVLDFGDQKLYDVNHAIELFPSLVESLGSVDKYEQVTVLYKALGLAQRDCLDYKDSADYSYDLNTSLVGNRELAEKYELVTNQGFSEHVFNQQATFEAIHHCCSANGLMFHVLPCQGWADGGGWGHGFYQYQPNFFGHLARCNNYKLLDLKLSAFSADPDLFNFSPADYPPFVNFHLLPKNEYLREVNQDRGIFSSILVLLQMPPKKEEFRNVFE